MANGLGVVEIIDQVRYALQAPHRPLEFQVTCTVGELVDVLKAVPEFVRDGSGNVLDVDPILQQLEMSLRAGLSDKPLDVGLVIQGLYYGTQPALVVQDASGSESPWGLIEWIDRYVFGD